MQVIGTNERRGLDGCSSQPRGERGATKEEGEVQIFFLIATVISFLSRNSSESEEMIVAVNAIYVIV